eukprot:6076038-Pyramimonas_sp.AAC.1
MYGSSDPRPSESRWTHTVPSFKRTLIRRLLHRVGLDCFVDTIPKKDLEDVDGQHVGIEQEGSDDYLKHVIRIRTKKVRDYYADDSNMYQLVVYVAILEVTDGNLLYPLLGDATVAKSESRSKLDTLLHEEDSIIGKFSQGMLDLLDGWNTGDPSRRQW